MPLVIALVSSHVDDDANWSIIALAEAAARYGPDAGALLTRSVNTAPDAHTRCGSLLLLSTAGVADSQRVIDVATRALGDSDPRVRVAAINTLAAQGASARSADVELDRMVSDSDERVRAAAQAATQRIREMGRGDSR
jgi:hypothetical protein